jgi:hypothetical protein
VCDLPPYEMCVGGEYVPSSSRKVFEVENAARACLTAGPSLSRLLCKNSRREGFRLSKAKDIVM